MTLDDAEMTLAGPQSLSQGTTCQSNPLSKPGTRGDKPILAGEEELKWSHWPVASCCLLVTNAIRATNAISLVYIF